MGIGEICTREVVIVEPEERVLTAASLMREQAVGDVVVVKAGKPVGILTDRDITIRVTAAGKAPDLTAVLEVMTPGVKTIRESAGLGDAIRQMRAATIRRLPVVNDEGRLVGIVTLDDLLDLMAEELEVMAALIRRQETAETSTVP